MNRQNEFAIGKNDNVFLIVSCSNVIPLKRINLIIETLATITKERIHWVHFGDGLDMEKMKLLAKQKLTNSNISYEFKGFVDRKTIYMFYNDNNPNLFISTSESEGSPVSIQEAMAFAIPIIGTDVGGVREAIDGNGILLSADPTVAEIRNAILLIYNAIDYEMMRKKSLDIWKEKFDLSKNMAQFVAEIDGLIIDD